MDVHATVANCICTQYIPLIFHSLIPYKTTKGSSQPPLWQHNAGMLGWKKSQPSIDLSGSIGAPQCVRYSAGLDQPKYHVCPSSLSVQARQLQWIGLLANLSRLIIICEAPSEVWNILLVRK